MSIIKILEVINIHLMGKQFKDQKVTLGFYKTFNKANEDVFFGNTIKKPLYWDIYPHDHIIKNGGKTLMENLHIEAARGEALRKEYNEGHNCANITIIVKRLRVNENKFFILSNRVILGLCCDRAEPIGLWAEIIDPINGKTNEIRFELEKRFRLKHKEADLLLPRIRKVYREVFHIVKKKQNP
jgi:hypothetical protein